MKLVEKNIDLTEMEKFVKSIDTKLCLRHKSYGIYTKVIPEYLEKTFNYLRQKDQHNGLIKGYLWGGFLFWPTITKEGALVISFIVQNAPNEKKAFLEDNYIFEILI